MATGAPSAREKKTPGHTSCCCTDPNHTVGGECAASVSSFSTGGVQVASLDYKEDSNGESPFHETSRCIMMRSSPLGTHLDPLWQTTMWLEACGDSLGEEDITWWLLVMLLTDGGTVAAKELAKFLISVWRWTAKVSTMPLYPPAPTMLNIGQFLKGCPRKGDHTPWLLAYACALQHMGEAAEGKTWHPSGVCCTPQISLLVDAFVEETGAELIELNTASCWGQLLKEVLRQKDEGPWADVISYMDELV